MHTRPLPWVRGLVLLCVLSVASPSWGADLDAGSIGLLSPDAAVAAALDLNPRLHQAQAALLTAQGQRAASALFLNNPELSGSSTLDGARANMELIQPLSVSGEGWHARAAARASEQAAQASLSRTRLVVAAQARQSYVQAVVAVGRVRIAQDAIQLGARLRQAVSRQLEVGEASTLDLSLARLSEVQAASALLAARGLEAQALRDLAEQVGAVVQAQELASDPLLAAPAPALDATPSRTDVAAAESELQAAQARLRRQRAAAMPAVGAGIFFEVEDSQRFVGPSLRMELPLFGRNQGARAAARGALSVAQSELDSLSARADAELLTARGRVAEADAVARAVTTDPAAEAVGALASVEAGYRAGELDLITTVLLQGEVLDGESAALELLGGIASARLDLLLASEDPALLGGVQ